MMKKEPPRDARSKSAVVSGQYRYIVGSTEYKMRAIQGQKPAQTSRHGAKRPTKKK
jgi:hypothetical protein